MVVLSLLSMGPNVKLKKKMRLSICTSISYQAYNNYVAGTVTLEVQFPFMEGTYNEAP